MGFTVKKVDKNQPQVVKKFRDVGASVAHIHMVGHGLPDVIVGCSGLTLVGIFDKEEVKKVLAGIEGLKVLDNANVLVEIKDDSQPPSKRKLTPDEEKWHSEWKGQISIVENEAEAESLMLDFD